MYESFAQKRQTLRDLVDRVRQFITEEENKVILEKLLPSELISSENWKLKDCEGLPSILVAGKIKGKYRIKCGIWLANCFY